MCVKFYATPDDYHDDQKDNLTKEDKLEARAKLMESKSLGTPKTLYEAVSHALCIGPLDKMHERTRQVMRDYLSQKFGVAILAAGDDEEADRLEKLFKSIVDEK